jgi:cell division protein FtsQ
MTGRTTVKRSGGAGPKGKATKQTRRKATPRKRTSFLAEMFRDLNIKPHMIERAVTWTVVGCITVLAGFFLYWSGMPQKAGLQMARAVGDAGFEVKNIEVTGIDRMERLAIYEVLLDQHSMAMPLVDLEAKRRELLGFGWVQDARVSRRLPDTLVVDIVERKPLAVWQHNQKLSLIDGEGKVLESVSAEAMPDLPILVGYDANVHAGSFAMLQDRVPSLKSKIAAASWIGGRRWDVQFKSGETLALPEGEEAAKEALIKFTQLEGTKRLLGRGYTRIDMRIPTNMVIRVPRDLNKAHASDGKGGTHKGGSSDEGEQG